MKVGLRRYELLNLKKHDIDFKRQNLRVIGKGDKERIIELHPMLIEKVFPSVVAKNGER